jgi:hypothetical protein
LAFSLKKASRMLQSEIMWYLQKNIGVLSLH